MEPVEVISSRKNSRVCEFAKIAADPRPDFAIVEGWHLVSELLRDAPNIARTLLMTEKFASGKDGVSAIQTAKSIGLEILIFTDDAYAKFSALKSPEGVAATFQPVEVPLAEIFAGERILIAAGIQDPGNAGALARCAEGAGFCAVLFTGGINPLNGKFLRATMGSVFRLPCLKCDGGDVVAAARVAKMPLIVAANTADARGYRDGFFPERGALVIGGEGAGVPEEFLAAAESKVKIPLLGKVESLNAAVAAGILMFAARDQNQ